MEQNHLLGDILFYSAAAMVCVPLFKKLGLGAILGYLFAGILLGPSVMGVAKDPGAVLHVAEFGVVMLLFIIGLELTPQSLWQMRGKILISGLGQMLLCALVLAGLLSFLIEDTQIVILLGLTLALSSTAFAIQLMAENKLLATPVGRHGFAMLLTQDLAVIPILLLVQAMAPGEAGADHQVSLMLSAGVLVAALVGGRYLLNPVFHLIAQYGNREVMTASALFTVFGMAVLMEAIGLSMGMGAFTAGVLLANSPFKHQLEADIEPFKGLLLGLFFIAVGMSMNLELIMSYPLELLALAIALLALKTLVIALILKAQKLHFRKGIQLGLHLSQGGEFAFVVVTHAMGLSLFTAELGQWVTIVVGLSMAMTPPAILAFNAWQRKACEQTAEDYDQLDTPLSPEVIIAGFGRVGQITGRILTANNIAFTAMDKDASHVEFVSRFGNKLFYGDATRPELLESAGIQSATLLLIAIDDEEASLQLARTAKQLNPNIEIVARARNRMHAYHLYDLGIEQVHRETFESSLMMAEQSLVSLGYTEGQALEVTHIFRGHDEKMLKENVKHKDDQQTLLANSKEGRKELESLFNQDS